MQQLRQQQQSKYNLYLRTDDGAKERLYGTFSTPQAAMFCALKHTVKYGIPAQCWLIRPLRVTN